MDIEKNNRKKLERILIIGVLAIFVVVSVTYAFFQAQLGDGASADVDLSSNTTDSLKFSVSGPISLNINQFNFGVGAGNLDSSATATATLLANNNTNTATFNYYVYFRINSNEYVYTTSDSKPEIILTVTDPEGNPVTSIDGLTYVPNIQTTTSDGSTQTVSGFDITTASGLFAVASDYNITADSTKQTVQEWEFTATFINLDSDQQGNTGKRMDAEIIIQEEALATTLGNAAEYIASLYATDGENGLYYHDADLTNGANDNSYRYAGANPNNYVCFGSDEETCPTDNLYRIIGVFDGQVKLIKYDYATSAQLGTDGSYYGAYDRGDSNYKGNNYANIAAYYWNNSTGTNTWSDSNLNTVNLNANYINYLNNIDSKWVEKIATTEWKVGGNTEANIRDANAPTAYQNEIVNPSEAITYSAKIGLMYVSDYMYGAAPTYWTKVGYNSSDSTADYRAAINDNWMYMGLYDWTISRYSDFTDGALFVNLAGTVGGDSVLYSYLGVRPSFYLESSVEFSRGSGSSADPYRLSIA